MNKSALTLCLALLLMLVAQTVTAQERRPIDNQHPLWYIHVDVWYRADPQKIIDLIPEDLRPYVCLNLSLSCQYDTEKNVYKMPYYAFQTYKSWGTVCQQNGMWFSCQPASGGHTHIQDTDMVTFEYFFKQFPNFLGWNYAEQFWGFDEAGDKSSATQQSRWELFARLVEMSHKYGGLLTVSFCGNIWSHGLNPIGELKRCPQFLQACQKYPESILFLYKYTTSSCFYNNESVCLGPFISGLTKNYGVRYDNCGWNGAMDALLGKEHGKKYPAAAGIGTVMEQTCVNGGAVWDGPELTWREECFHEVNSSTVDGYQRRNWQRFPNFNGVWIDMFRQVINGTMYIPTREEVVGKTKIVIINDVSSGSDEDKYATWDNLYDGLYLQTDPFNADGGQWMKNYTYFKKTGRYGAIPMVTGLYDNVAKQIPVQVKKSQRNSVWSTIAKKQNAFNAQYPEVSTGDLYVNRYLNQLVTYTPYTYLNSKTTAQATIPLQYNTCETLELKYDKLSSGIIREYADHIDFYLNNYRSDSTALRTDIITVRGASENPAFTVTKHKVGTTTVNVTTTESYDDGVYTLTVKHCGPVSLTVSCAGTADRSSAAALPQPAALPEPQAPALYRGPVIIEAEDMDYRNVKSCVTDYFNTSYNSVRGHAGNGFVDMGTNSNGSLRHYLNLKDGQEGDYHIVIRYTCSSKDGNLTVSVNGTSQTVDCAKTATNEWRTVSIDASLTTGRNTLLINNSNALPVYIDQVTYQPADVEPMKYDVTILTAENGIVTADCSSAAEGDVVTLTVSADKDYSLSALRMVNSVFFTAGKSISVSSNDAITFVMPHDNVTLQPVFVNTSASASDAITGYTLNLADATTSMPEGWRCVQENDEVHEYNASYGQGSRIMQGFSGYQGKALYWRNNRAEYGRQEQYPLTLTAGSYELTFAMAAWKEQPRYKVSILNAATGKAVASSAVLTAAPNANGSTAANVSSATLRKLEFDIATAGQYIISFTDETSAGGYHEYLLLECSLKSLSGDYELASDIYHEWDGCSAWAQVVKVQCGGANEIGKELEAGNLIYGDGSVYYTHYANLTGFGQMVIYGTPGMQIRVLMNRLEIGNGGGDNNGGALTELNPVIGDDGKAVVSFDGYDFVHLNALKVGWGSPSGTITSVKLLMGDSQLPLFIKGDANGDGKVDIVDVTTTISYILGQVPENFNVSAADVNGDEKVDIVDVTSIIDIILSAK